MSKNEGIKGTDVVQTKALGFDLNLNMGGDMDLEDRWNENGGKSEKRYTWVRVDVGYWERYVAIYTNSVGRFWVREHE